MLKPGKMKAEEPAAVPLTEEAPVEPGMPAEVADKGRESGREQKKGGAASSSAGLPGGNGREEQGGWTDRRSRRDRRHAEAPGWSRRGQAGRTKLRNRDGGDVLRKKSGWSAASVGEREPRPPERVPSAGRSLRVLRSPGNEEREGWRWGMPCMCWDGVSEQGAAASGERGLAAQPPTLPVPRPRPLGTGQPAAGTGCRCSRRGPAAQRDAGEGSAKRWSETKRSRVKIAGGRERCQFIRTPSTRGGRARRLHTSSPLRRG